MHSATVLLALSSLLIGLNQAYPTTDLANLEKRESGTPGDAYKCSPSSNAAARKKELQSIGANATDLAITIFETSCNMDGTSYPFGDVYPPKAGEATGKPKTGDAANFGLFKNNWLQIRTYCSDFHGMAADDWREGASLNTDDKAAIKCQHQQMNAQGQAQFYIHQRDMSHPAGGPEYAKGVMFIENYIRQGHLNDDMVTFYNLAAV